MSNGTPLINWRLWDGLFLLGKTYSSIVHTLRDHVSDHMESVFIKIIYPREEKRRDGWLGEREQVCCLL